MIVETYSQIHSNVFYSNLPLYPAESILPSREVCSTLAEEWIKDFSVRRNLGSDENKVVVFYNNHKWEDTTYIPWLLHPRKIEKIHIDWRSPESYMTYPSKAANLKSPFMVVVNRIADALEEVILSVPPRVFFIQGDEWLSWGHQSFLLALQKKGTLILRNYNNPALEFLPASKPNQNAPCGVRPAIVYPTGLNQNKFDDEVWENTDFMEAIASKAALTPISKRRFSVSFIGTVRFNRKEMVDAFAQVPHQGPIGRWNSSEVIKVYSNSKFVLNGRGHHSLNCFRLYETFMSGAIPITLGNSVEGAYTYFFGPLSDGKPRGVDPKTLPWIVVNSYSEGADKVKQLLDKPEELDMLQNRMMDWWERTICLMRKYIHEALSDTCRLSQ
eukprot:CAMPEP_0204830008 /NCGR_PEP_ID=MMETSP1346-20131115/8277_1 /ASSEMBLY_ACC=CAM_ASM_000771 /TAXON_ID=215587 /ORGANISM="Aplanochytrium stocchinoi, Strain GSBS06" /LENGTH=385 /DNA_ID=CAMNT_0051960121 /DNA_START=273 /DNA_END=1430 /DNA_ORIENTATION=-